MILEEPDPKWMVETFEKMKQAKRSEDDSQILYEHFEKELFVVNDSVLEGALSNLAEE